MEKDKYISLIYKKLKGEISSSEQSALDHWLSESEKNPPLFHQIKKEWELSGNYSTDLNIDAKADFEKLRNRIHQHKAREDQPAKVVQMRPRRQWLAWAAAAAILMVGGWWLFNKNIPDNEMLMAKTATGEKMDFILSDGTKIWLNENSSLHYPKNTLGNKRLVRLEGEAYFDVTKNENEPFIIEANAASVKVLGTTFNVRSYANEPIVEVIVEEGKVQLQPNNSQQSVILTANQKGIYDVGENSLKQLKAENKNAIFWKTGTLIYKNTSLKKVATDLISIFNVKINIENTDMEQCQVTGRFPNAKPKNILEQIANSFQMELVESGNGVYELKNGACQ